MNSTNDLVNIESGLRSKDTRQEKNQRTPVLFSGTAGVNLKYPVGNGSLLVSANYAYGFSNAVNKDKRWDNIGFISAKQYVDSDISFNPFYLTVGYQLPLRGMYSVKKQVRN